MIRLIQRRLIIPRGDTGTFTVPLLATAQTGDVSVFTIFDQKTQKKVFEKIVTIEGEALQIEFSHADTVNLPVGDYVWDIKFYKDPIIVDDKLVNGTEIDSYYAAFKLPVCEIRQTGDALLTADDAPTTTIEPNSLNVLTAAMEITSQNKASVESAAATVAEDLEEVEGLAAQVRENAETAGNAATSASESASAASESASEAATSANNAAASVTEMEALVRAIPTNVSEFENDAGYITDDDVPVKDVQVNGISVLTDSVANVPVATAVNLGVVYASGPSGGIAVTSEGLLKISTPSLSDYKNLSTNTKAPVLGGMKIATFYALAKAAGDSTQSASSNPIGTYTDEAKQAIQTMLDVPSNADMQQAIANVNTMKIHICTAAEYNSETGVPTIASPDTQTFYLVPGGQGNNLFIEWVYVNGAWERFGSADVDLSNYVQFDDYAKNSKAGVVRVNPNYGLVMQDGIISIRPSTDGDIKTGTTTSSTVTPQKQHISTFYGLAKAAGDTTQSASSNAVGTYTDEAKAAIQQMLDVPSNGDIPNVPVQDVQVNNVSIIDTNGIANIDVASVEEVLEIIAQYDLEEDDDMVFETTYETITLLGKEGNVFMSVDDAADIIAAYKAGKHVVLHFPAVQSINSKEAYSSAYIYSDQYIEELGDGLTSNPLRFNLEPDMIGSANIGTETTAIYNGKILVPVEPNSGS